MIDNMDNKKYRVAIYNRCSTEEEAQVNALQVQVEESLEKAKQLNWEVVDQYVESKSGTTVDNRSEYQRLVNDMSLNKFDIVMIKSIDRLNRNTFEWYSFIDKLIKNNLRLYIYIDNKFYTDDDKIISGFKAMIAEDFSKELSKKIKNAHRRRQDKKSGFNITKEIYGWDKVDKDVYVINEEEADIVREIYMMCLEGVGRRNIARTLERRGVVRKDGKPLSEMNIKGILNSPRYYGTMVMHTNEMDFNLKKRVKVPQSEFIYVDDAFPPIISKDLYDRVHSASDDRNSQLPAFGAKRDMSKVGKHKLSGKLYCGCCGSVYYRYRPKSGNGVELKQWKCSKAILSGRATDKNKDIGCNNRNVYEGHVYDAIRRACEEHYNFLFASNDNIVDELLSTIRQVISNDTSQTELESLNKELNKQKDRKNILFDKLMNQVISDSDFKIYNDKISENIASLEDKIDKIKFKTSDIIDLENRIIKIKESLSDVDMLNEAKISSLIDRIDKIIVYDKTIRIIFNKNKISELFKIYDCLNEHELDEKYYTIDVECSSLTDRALKTRRNRQDVNDKILMYLKETPTLKLKDLYQLFDCKKSYIDTSVWQLEKEGRLKNIKTGLHDSRWVVIDIEKQT
jgi:DNA invertase Pin-like site-specific DNA recombinase